MGLRPGHRWKVGIGWDWDQVLGEKFTKTELTELDEANNRKRSILEIVWAVGHPFSFVLALSIISFRSLRVDRYIKFWWTFLTSILPYLAALEAKHIVSISGSQVKQSAPARSDAPQKSSAPPKKVVDINEPQTCRNQGCGKTFKEKDNHETACSYHPGPAVFHDRLRGVRAVVSVFAIF